jgi:transcription-repair coupling factor (superfamily II helicase)
LAQDLLKLYAAREVEPGHAFPTDSPWQTELEASFAYIETDDQLTAIAAVKRDMEGTRPMDRLVCGDVGYGKTEVGIRAAFKAVMDGKQVGVLVPTTVLALQHFHTFYERLAAFPMRVEMLSRFRTEAEQREVVADLAAGSVDIVIGTHRLLQKDITFKNLGLVIIDEEQRFGVAHKERLKQMRKQVDILTLSATPIPRTLYMALGGIRDMSTMETPPAERLPIKTYVSEFDSRLVHEAIVREIERRGQVYFVHNRVHNIRAIAERIRRIVPEATIDIAHGQMEERGLERAMEEFVRGDTDVLVCTTIIESGLDIPNVNTIIINQANRLGLGQMYQLRGRVGRGAHRAYAYLLYDPRSRLTDTARRRMQTIFEATDLGAGFQIALRDLEIRGAGNLLGPEQSGFMSAVGFDLYVRLLNEAVERMRALARGEVPPPVVETPGVTIELPLSAHFPSSYVPDVNQRLALYQRLSDADDAKDVSLIAQEMVDRFGDPPPLVRNLLYVAVVRTLAIQGRVRSISTDGNEAIVRLEDGVALPREALEARAPKGVQVGRTMLHVELGDGWRDRLQRALELVTAVTGEKASAEP